MRIVFMGSPEFALPALRRLIESEHEVAAVYTQPDRPVGRGRRPAPPPVKLLALDHGIEVRQPASIGRPEPVEELRRLAPDIGVIAAYGQILKQPVLDVPPLGVLNVHASLLPRWRGAAPIPAAILAGDAETGATIMRVRLALDAGPVLASVHVPIAPSDTTGTLTPKVAEAGAELLMRVLPAYVAGAISPVEQDEALATYAPQIRKTDALIDWERDDAQTVWRKVRAYNPWPGAYTYAGGEPLRILACLLVERGGAAAPRPDAPLRTGRMAGSVFALHGTDAGFGVVAREGAVAVTSVQAPGGRVMPAAAYLRGHPRLVGTRLTAPNVSAPPM
ncbi:MAG: methionyl-tRNA formyltransferase [Chloroflexota bacterium]|nr:methionyl-tRNA formyltransferase [Chloroflexota bacterium]